mmetsp:Transcript_36444/g.72077  ORF Transcript_36444/g.72077 Transcript_36444/m.72077 type:complete len:230 (-) Transcript_36444:46-735(-)
MASSRCPHHLWGSLHPGPRRWRRGSQDTPRCLHRVAQYQLSFAFELHLTGWCRLRTPRLTICCKFNGEKGVLDSKQKIGRHRLFTKTWNSRFVFDVLKMFARLTSFNLNAEHWLCQQAWLHWSIPTAGKAIAPQVVFGVCESTFRIRATPGLSQHATQLRTAEIGRFYYFCRVVGKIAVCSAVASSLCEEPAHFGLLAHCFEPPLRNHPCTVHQHLLLFVGVGHSEMMV